MTLVTLRDQFVESQVERCVHSRNLVYTNFLSIDGVVSGII